jgi:4'-phosphopantetheinyl transferase
MNARDPTAGDERGEGRHLGEADFEVVEGFPALGRRELHLWHWQAAADAAVRDVPKLARERLDRLLQAYGGRAAQVSIARGPHGKPFAAAPGYPHFNTSHARHCVVFAFAAEQEIGVDVEAEDRRHAPMELATRFFAAEESAALAALDEAQRAAAFLSLWTAKEAVLKALGLGLSFGLDRLRFDLHDGGRSTRLRALDTVDGNVEDWRLLRFQPASGHVGALAWRGPPLRIRALRLPD